MSIAARPLLARRRRWQQRRLATWRHAHAVTELRMHERRSARSRRKPDLSLERTCPTLLRASSC